MNPQQTTFIFFATASALLAWVVSFSELQIFLFLGLGILWMFILQKSKQELSNFTIVLSEVFGILIGLIAFYIIWYLSQTPEVRSSDWEVGLMVGGLIFVFQTISATLGIIGYSFASSLINKRVA